MRKIAAALLSLVFFFPSAEHCRAQTFRLVSGDIVPYAIAEGPRHGFAVDIVVEMARRAGIGLTVQFLPWQRALAEAAHGSNTLIVPVVRTEEREASYNWIAPIVPGEPFYLLAIRPDIDISGFDAVKEKVVGAMANAPAENILRRAQLPRVNLATDNIVNARMLLARRFDVWFARLGEAKIALTDLGFDTSQLRHGLRVDSPPSFLAASPDFPAAAAHRLTKALDEMKNDGSFARIIDSYGFGWLIRNEPQ